MLFLSEFFQSKINFLLVIFIFLEFYSRFVFVSSEKRSKNDYTNLLVTKVDQMFDKYLCWCENFTGYKHVLLYGLYRFYRDFYERLHFSFWQEPWFKLLFFFWILFYVIFWPLTFISLIFWLIYWVSKFWWRKFYYRNSKDEEITFHYLPKKFIVAERSAVGRWIPARIRCVSYIPRETIDLDGSKTFISELSKVHGLTSHLMTFLWIFVVMIPFYKAYSIFYNTVMTYRSDDIKNYTLTFFSLLNFINVIIFFYLFGIPLFIFYFALDATGHAITTKLTLEGIKTTRHWEGQTFIENETTFYHWYIYVELYTEMIWYNYVKPSQSILNVVTEKKPFRVLKIPNICLFLFSLFIISVFIST